jgi:hypothetical protein
MTNSCFYTPAGFALEPTTQFAEKAYNELSDIINRWLVEPFNSQLLSTDFPQNFIETNGGLLLDLISFLTGKKVPVFSATLTNFSKRIYLMLRSHFLITRIILL